MLNLEGLALIGWFTSVGPRGWATLPQFNKPHTDFTGVVYLYLCGVDGIVISRWEVCLPHGFMSKDFLHCYDQSKGPTEEEEEW